MFKFTIGSVFLKINEKELKQILNDIFYHYHDNKANKKNILDDKKFPVFKKTNDIFSVIIWVKNSKNEEKRIFIDGTIFLNELKIHTISLEGEYFEDSTIKEFIFVFESLFSKNSIGYLYYEIDGYLYRVNNENKKNYHDLIEELYSAIPLEKQLSYKILKENLQMSFTEN